MTSPFNPYQAPVYDQMPQPVQAGDFDIGVAFKDGYTLTSRHFGMVLGATLLCGLMVILSAVTVVGYFLAVPVFAWGMIKFFLNLQDERAQVSDLFSGFSNYGTVLGRMLLLTVIYIFAAGASESVVFVGQYLKSLPIQLVGWVIYLTFFVTVVSRFYFAYFFVVDKDMSTMDALSAAWTSTRGKTLKLVGLATVTFLVAMSGVVGLVIGLLFTIPMSYVMYSSAFRQVAGNQPPPQRGW